MKTKTIRASAFRITISIALLSISAILLASSFKSAHHWPSLAADVMEMPIPIAHQAIATLGNNIYSFSGASDGALTGLSYEFDGKTWRGIAPYPATTWMTGDVFAGVGIGQYNVYDNSGNFKETIGSGDSQNTAGCGFNPALDKLYTTHFQASQVIVFDN